MILARVIYPASKLATARQLDVATATSSLAPLLELPGRTAGNRLHRVMSSTT